MSIHVQHVRIRDDTIFSWANLQWTIPLKAYKFHATGRRLGPLLHMPQAETIVNLDVPQVQKTFSLCWRRFEKENVMSVLAGN